MRPARRRGATAWAWGPRVLPRLSAPRRTSAGPGRPSPRRSRYRPLPAPGRARYASRSTRPRRPAAPAALRRRRRSGCRSRLGAR
ncbi:hypothetical protein G6F68_020395 [Rhizopus microsporus]|nr:hypothetical protein G6F68_020395 [Rhizopus microsporus]